MSGKMLEVLKEIAPRVRRVAVFYNPVQAPQIAMWHAIEAVAPSLGVEVSPVSPRVPLRSGVLLSYFPQLSQPAG